MDVRNATRRWLAAGLLALVPALPAAADDFSRVVEAPAGGTLRVRLDVGSVRIESHDDPVVRVEAHASGAGADGVVFDLDRKGPVVELRSRSGGGWGLASLFGGPRVHVEVRVPEVFSVDVRTAGGSVSVEEVQGDVEVRTSGGELSVDRVRGDVELRTSGGSIEAESVSGRVVARTSGGDVAVSEASSADLRTSGGRIEVLDIDGEVRARTSGGPITARFSRSPRGQLVTSGGTIEVAIPEDAAVSLDARTSGGRIEVEQPVQARGSSDRGRLVGDVNGGGPKLELRTSGGDIRISAD